MPDITTNPAPRVPAGPASLAVAYLAMQQRSHIEAAIETLIATLDARDGNPDREDDDPAGDWCDTSECGEAEMNYRPVYGDDQSELPINHKAIERDHFRKVMAGMTDAEIVAANRGSKGFLPGGAA